MTESAVSKLTWEDLEQEIFTPEEIAESDRRVAELTETIQARKETETQDK